MAQDDGKKTSLSHTSQEVDDAVDAVAELPEQLAAKQDALTFGTSTAKDSTESLTSGAIWAAIWSQIFGVNSNKNLSQDVPEGGYDCDTLTDVGIYRVPSDATAAAIANLPIAAGGRLIVMNLGLANRYLQVYLVSGARFYMRRYISTGWQSWYEYAGTEVVSAASMNAVGGETA